MPRKTKASPEDKVQIVEAYLRGEIGIKSAAAKLAVVTSTIELWVALYRAEGPNAFIQAKRNRCYPPEVKEAAVREYLSGKDTTIYDRKRTFDKCKAALWAAAQPHHAFAKIGVGIRGRKCVCHLHDKADGR